MPEGARLSGVGSNSVVREVPPQYLPKPRALLRNRVVPVSMQQPLDFAQRGLHSITTRHALERKRVAARAATDVRETHTIQSHRGGCSTKTDNSKIARASPS